MVVGCEIRIEDLRRVFLADLFGDLVLELVVVVEEVADEVEHLACADEVLARFVAAAAEVEDLEDVVLIFEERQDFGLVGLCPAGQEIIQFLRRDLHEDILGDVVEFCDVEQGAGGAHLLKGEREFVAVCVRVGHAPFLVVGVEDGQQVFADGERMVAELLVEVECEFRVLSLGELALVAVLVDLHQDGGVAVHRHFKAECCEQFVVDRQAGEPLFAADDVGHAHQVVVAGVREVVGRQAHRLDDDDILEVLRHGEFAADGILHVDLRRLFRIALGAQTDDGCFTGVEVRLHFFDRQVAALGEAAVDAGSELLRFLFRADSSDLLFGHEAGIRLAFCDELLGEAAVQRAAVALVVGTVIADLAFLGSAFVEVDPEIVQTVDDGFDCAFHKALVVGVLDAQQEQAAVLVGEALIDERTVQVAQMDEAGRARSKTGHRGACRKVAGGIHRLIVFRGLVDVREKQVCKFLIVHNVSPYV